jgi:predicted permease
VLYTKLPIDKNPAYYDNYKLYGYIGGLSFLLVPVIWEAFEYIFPILDNLSVANQMMWMTVLMLFGIGGIATIYYALKKSHSSPEKTL